MSETKLLGYLWPSHPDVKPIIKKLREKYDRLVEISPDDDPISELYLGDEIITLEIFWQEIKDMVDESEILINPDSDIYQVYNHSKRLKGKPPKLTREEKRLPRKYQQGIVESRKKALKLNKAFLDAIDKRHSDIANMIYTYLLTGESEEVPGDWFSKVTTVNIDGEILISVMATQVANPEEIMSQFYDLFEKTYGSDRPKITELAVSTAHYLMLQKMGHEWNYIVGEYIRINKFKMPNYKKSPEYAEAYKKHEQRLRKRIDRTKSILEVRLKDVDKNQ